MRATVNRRISMRRRFAAILASVLCIPQWAFGMGSAPTPPLTLPFAANKKGAVVETELRVKEHRNYLFLLAFRFKEHDETDAIRVSKLITEGYSDEQGRYRLRNQPVVLVQIVDLAAGAGRTVFDQKLERYQSGLSGSGVFERQIASIELKPGHYRVRIESLVDVPVLSAVQMQLVIGYYPKSTPISN